MSLSIAKLALAVRKDEVKATTEADYANYVKVHSAIQPINFVCSVEKEVKPAAFCPAVNDEDQPAKAVKGTASSVYPRVKNV